MLDKCSLEYENNCFMKNKKGFGTSVAKTEVVGTKNVRTKVVWTNAIWTNVIWMPFEQMSF